MIIDDDTDIITTFKFGIENATKRISVDTYNDPIIVLLDFQPNFYDLSQIDINMPYIDGFQLSECYVLFPTEDCFNSVAGISVETYL